jgi:ubiquinone/menaquinone biosynthesis C-methylase UbiE
MDEAAEVREYQDMDHSDVNRTFLDDLYDGGPVGPRVVDLGCGPADILVALCQRAPDVEALGIDVSVAMLEAARLEIELGSVQGRIYLEHADCKALAEFEAASADTVISNSLVHHLPQPEAALREALRLVKPGGRLFVRDLARPESEEHVEALVRQHAGEETAFAQQLLRQSLHAALTVAEVQALIEPLGIDREAVRQTSDRHWTLDWTVPAS